MESNYCSQSGNVTRGAMYPKGDALASYQVEEAHNDS